MSGNASVLASAKKPLLDSGDSVLTGSVTCLDATRYEAACFVLKRRFTLEGRIAGERHVKTSAECQEGLPLASTHLCLDRSGPADKIKTLSKQLKSSQCASA